MNKKAIVYLCLAVALCLTLTTVSYGAEQCKESKVKTFWQKLFNYPANVTKDSVATVAETGKRSADVVANEVKTVGKVTSGSIEKTPDLVVEPVKGTAETVAKAVVETSQIPVEAAKKE
ncbi:MAG: hypothetical protein JXB40_01370 [Candidatus Omnitrophica bacterium]|nr:hypothetical protein [Candidatus Omnitrophota bacterium]